MEIYNQGGDAGRTETRYHSEFIHNVLGCFYKDVLDYFAEYLYPRFSNWKVMGTYDKAVEYLSKLTEMNRETDQAMKPALILNPSGEFDFDDGFGKMLYRFPNLAPGFVKYLFDPIYEDQNVKINVGFSRLKGSIEMLALLASYYEYLDFKMLLMLIFNGKDRIIYPRWFKSYIILPKEIWDYQYINDVTGESYKINIPDAYTNLIKTTNKSEVVFPCNILPRLKLANTSDASERLGGSDRLPEWKLSFSIDYEIEVPTFLILERDFLVANVDYNIRYLSAFTDNEDFGQSLITNNKTLEYENIFKDENGNVVNINDNSSMDMLNITVEETKLKSENETLIKDQYVYIVTSSDSSAEIEFVVDLPSVVENETCVKVLGKHGYLNYGDHYILTDTNDSLIINKKTVFVETNDVLEILIYKIDYHKDY